MGRDGGAWGRGVHHIDFSNLEDGEEKVRRDVLVLRVDAGLDDLKNVDAFLLKCDIDNC